MRSAAGTPVVPPRCDVVLPADAAGWKEARRFANAYMARGEAGRLVEFRVQGTRNRLGIHYAFDIITFWTIVQVPRTFKHDSMSVNTRGGTCNFTFRTASSFSTSTDRI